MAQIDVQAPNQPDGQHDWVLRASERIADPVAMVDAVETLIKRWVKINNEPTTTFRAGIGRGYLQAVSVVLGISYAEAREMALEELVASTGREK